jgi:hypothetical protein
MAVEGRTQESDIEIRSEKEHRQHRPEVGDTMTLVNAQGVVLKDGNGRLWIGITDLATPSGGVVAHLVPEIEVEVTGEIEDGLEVSTQDDPTTPITETRRLRAYRLRGALLEHVEEQLG